VLLVEQAKALLSRSAPHAGLDEIHLRAMRALVAELERKRYAVTAHSRQDAGDMSVPAQAAPARATHEAPELDGGARSADGPEPEPEPEPEPDPAVAHASNRAHESERKSPRRRGRHVRAAIRRAVFARDEMRCTYTDELGQRCRETHGLELHHERAFARGGAHSPDNLTLRCRAHNALAAEQDFGRVFIERARDSAEHERWGTQTGHGAR
jgi:5-methylcytosine-specific restriction endonuclease McrA